MTMSDPIADMLNRMRNAIMRVQPTLAMPHSKAKEAVAAVHCGLCSLAGNPPGSSAY